MYKQTFGLNGKIQNAVLRLEDNAFIVFEESNQDYQAYLKWVSEGNKPEPADE